MYMYIYIYIYMYIYICIYKYINIYVHIYLTCSFSCGQTDGVVANLAALLKRWDARDLAEAGLSDKVPLHPKPYNTV